MNDLGRKLVREGSDKTRLRVNLISLAIGACLLFAGAVCLGMKPILERMEESELFFLIPVSALFSICGLLAFLITGVRNTVFLFRSQRKGIRRRYLAVTCGCTGMILAYAAALAFLIEVNSGKAALPALIACAAAALACFIAAVVLRIGAGKYEDKEENA